MPPCTNEWGNILWESVVKYTEIDKEKKNKQHPMFYFECVILFIHITKQSPVKFLSAPKRRKSVVGDSPTRRAKMRKKMSKSLRKNKKT